MPSAAILAGGHARRFGGADKSRLIVDGRSILDRQLHELSRITDEVLIVAGTAGDRDRWRDAVEPRREITVRVIVDRVPDSGPLGGLDAALTEARDPELLLLACDMPYVTAEFMRYLLTLAGDADAVVPATEDGYHPLCAVYTRACHHQVQRCLVEKRLAMSDLLDRLRVRVVGTADIETFGRPGQLLANVNARPELDALEAPSHKL